MKRGIVWSLAAMLAAGAAPGIAQDFPTKPVRAIVSFTPGSATDIVGRIVAAKLAEYWGQPVVVENRSGAGGAIGSAAVSKSAPDGYTLLINSSAHSVNPAIFANLPYDTVKDFTDIAALAIQPNVLVVAADSPVQDARGPPRLREGEPGEAQLRPRRHRQRHPPQHREAALAGRHHGDGGAVQGHPGGGRRDPQRVGRLLLGADLRGAVEHPQREASRPGDQHGEAQPAAPRPADHRRGGREGRRDRAVVRPVGAARDAAGPGREDQRRRAQGASPIRACARSSLNLGNDTLDMSPAEFSAFIREEIDVNKRILSAAGVKPQ